MGVVYIMMYIRNRISRYGSHTLLMDEHWCHRGIPLMDMLSFIQDDIVFLYFVQLFRVHNFNKAVVKQEEFRENFARSLE